MKPIPTITKTIKIKFFERVIKNKDSCWEWIGYKDKDGYGLYGFSGFTIRTHRFSYLIHIGAIPIKLCVCHSCDNPGCVNPKHLWLGTNRDNVLDALQKGRPWGPIGCKRSVETKLKISKALKGRIISEEIKKKIAKGMMGKKNASGHLVTNARKLELSKAMVGNKFAVGHHHTEEVKLRISKTLTGRIHSEETKKKVSDAKIEYWKNWRKNKQQQL